MPYELTSHELSSYASFDNGVDDIPVERIFKPASQKVDSITPLEASNGCKTWFRQIDSSTEIHGLLAPKIVGACEDAPPLGISAQSESQKSVYLSVMDGMGGAGAGQVHVSLPSAEFSTTEALIASRSVRDTVLKQVIDKQLFSPNSPIKDITKDLKKCITDDLELIDAACKISSSSKIRGTLTKRLPTTLLLAKIEPNQKDQRLQKTNFWWAGDSRAFLIQPKHGLASLSIDHVGPSDALEQLRSDPPIQNTISSSVPFSINYGSININGPYILLLASDGVFGYLPTPGMLELGILEATQLPAKDFASNLMNFCGTYAADDVSAAILTYNIFNNDDVLAVFSKRLEVLRERYKSLQAMDSSTEEYSTEVERLWNLERPQYERLIRGAK